MRSASLLLLLCLSLASLAVFVTAQPNTPSTYNAAHVASLDPCAGISVQTWVAPPLTRVTTDPHFDESVAADYASLWTGRDQEFYFPNGFRKGQVYEDNNPPFCFSVGGTLNRQVQVMLQTVDDQARLCIRDTNSGSGGIERCFTDKTVACFGGMTYASSVNLMVYIDSQGATTSTAFWYRVRVSEVQWSLTGDARANSAIQNLEMWCMMQDQDQALMKFPKDLRSVVPPDSASKVVVTSAAAATPRSTVAAGIAFVAAAFAGLMAL